MNELKINEYRVVDDGNEKPFCVYVLEININGSRYLIEKRYSQFHSLHGELRKLYSTPFFPPKKVRSLQPKILEKRRQALEKYMQTMLRLSQSRSQILSFLGINKIDNDHLRLIDVSPSRERRLDHQPVFQFRNDFSSENARKSTMPDIITEGVLLALYKTP